MIAVDPEIEKLIPDDLIREAQECGIERISAGQWYDPFLTVFGVWRSASKEILLDIGREEGLKAFYGVRFPELHLRASEIFSLLLLHEIGHARGFRGEEEATQWAVKRFVEWRNETRKKIVSVFKEALAEGFRTRTL